MLAQRTLQSREEGYKLARQRFDVGASSALDLRLQETLVQSARVSVLPTTSSMMSRLPAIRR